MEGGQCLEPHSGALNFGDAHRGAVVIEIHLWSHHSLGCPHCSKSCLLELYASSYPMSWKWHHIETECRILLGCIL